MAGTAAPVENLVHGRGHKALVYEHRRRGNTCIWWGRGWGGERKTQREMVGDGDLRLETVYSIEMNSE